MRRIIKCALILALVVLGVSLSTLVAANPAHATTNGCYGASCNGRDPSGLCDDGVTVAAMHVNMGMLELRYSPSCKSNWGRYTPYGKDSTW